MSSPCLRNRGGFTAIMLLGAAACLAGCSKEPAASENDTPLQNTGAGDVAVSTLFPGGGKAPPLNQVAKSYEGNAQAITEGERLFTWYNCAGCHFHGGGGIGPALMDNKWIYGDRIDQIYASIAQGRPNGMPSWGAKLAPDQIWMLAAYVQSLSAKADKIPIPKEPAPAVPGPASLETAPESATR
jgi:cytochrome c oxidase cbb3-type subunit III